MMIDWVTAKIPFHAPGRLHDGQVMSFDRNGEIKYHIDQRLPVFGSYSDKIHVRTAGLDTNGDTCLIEFIGNPVKFLQGHNVFGSSDLLNLMYETTLKVSETLGLPQPQSVLDQLKAGTYTLSRVDLNEMYQFRDRAEVLAWLYTASQTSRTRSQGAVTRGTTVYWNKTSKRWSVKAYAKGQELALLRNKDHLLPESLRSYSDAALRIELTLKSDELRETGLYLAANWLTIEESDVFHDYVGRIQMSEQKTTGELFLKIESRPAAASYQMWLEGHDLRQILPKNTFYRHRRLLLEHGVDISIPHVREEQRPSNVVPLKSVLQMRVAEIPAWAYGTDWLFEPRKFA